MTQSSNQENYLSIIIIHENPAMEFVWSSGVEGTFS